MSHAEPHRPNVIGCAFGIAIGYVLGTFTGTAYAFYMRRGIDRG